MQNIQENYLQKYFCKIKCIKSIDKIKKYDNIKLRKRFRKTFSLAK
ncbi:hypothetical protein CLOSTHATH_02088 [Hungatella hathewayi DSM 13479]|uniref:Uncharacterized protein n=1 Tax=Hungatella hathewayi DSM 13479 TaxID=566550 RepID=D3AEQ4_9FIRM|nr:hypothetical protein CLOSTHATH_02088 [Hungatella hathewayi DSM 13479]